MAVISVSDVPVALIMLAIGWKADTTEMGSVLNGDSSPNRIAFLATIGSTLLLIPSVAFAIVSSTPGLSAEAVLGIVVVSLLPGGPLSNVAALVVGANKELNMLLTSVEMVLSGGLVPLGLLIVLPRVVDAHQVISVPYGEQVHGILLIVVPLLAGILASYIAAGCCFAGVKRPVFRALVLCAVVLVVAAKMTGHAEESIFLQALPLIRAVHRPPLVTVIAALQFGCITVAWSFALGMLLPSQPLPNRMSICLEVGVRDLTFGLVIAIAGLPSLAAPERANVVIAVLIAWATCNFGVVTVALLTCICSGGLCGRRPRAMYLT